MRASVEVSPGAYRTRISVECDGEWIKDTERSYKKEVIFGLLDQILKEGKLVEMEYYYGTVRFEFELEDKKATALAALLKIPPRKWKLWKEAYNLLEKKKSLESVLWKIAPAVLCEKL